MASISMVLVGGGALAMCQLLKTWYPCLPFVREKFFFFLEWCKGEN